MDANELAAAREYWASQNILQGSDEIEHRLSINLILDALEAAERERDELRAAVRALAHYAWHEDRCPGPHIAGERCPLLHARNLPAVQRALEVVMPTDAEIGKFLTERVLGWELEFDLDIPFPPGAVWPTRPTPDFLTWDGFGLLLTALVKAGREPQIGSDYDVVGPCKQGAYVNDDEGWPVLVIDPDPCRALMLAAAKAYGMEGV